jgi:hypothetical protein
MMKMINTINRDSERGSARLKFVIVIAIIGVVAYCGYQFIPVAYQAYQVKDLMQNYVDTAVAVGHPASWVKDQLAKKAPEYGIPDNVVITPAQADNKMEVRVQYTLPIEFPGYVYDYEFDHTAKSAAFLTVK